MHRVLKKKDETNLNWNSSASTHWITDSFPSHYLTHSTTTQTSHRETKKQWDSTNLCQDISLWWIT